MKKLLLAALLCFSTPAFADNACNNLYSLSGTIANARLNGMEYGTALQIASDSELVEMANFLVNWAYSLDLSGTETEVRVEVKAFQSKVYIMCEEYGND